MSAEQISASLDDLIALAIEGKWEIAYEKYYAPELEKTDLDGVVIKGKEMNIEIGRTFSSKISNVRDFSCAGKVVNGTRSFVIWSLDFDVDGAPFKVTEVAVQDWGEGKILRERFFA